MIMDQQSIDNAAIRIASNKLRDAILAARAGTCVVTPSEPVKLPRDPALAREAGRKGSEVLAKPESEEDAILRMYGKGKDRVAIAKALGHPTWSAVHGVLLQVKKQSPFRYWQAVERHNRARGLVE
jgi:hypothetical protein